MKANEFKKGDPVWFRPNGGSQVKGTLVNKMGAAVFLVLYDGKVWMVPVADAQAEEGVTVTDEAADIYDQFEGADWGDGSLSPEAELRKAALDHKGRP